MKYNIGDKIFFAEEKLPYTVRACDNRFLVCTKVFKLKPKTVLHTIVDLEAGIRSTDGCSIGTYSYDDDYSCKLNLEELQSGKSYISHVNRIALNIVKSISGKS